MMEGTCTIIFEPPFWVGLFTTIDNKCCRVARYTFRTEPSGPELIQFALEDFVHLKFSNQVAIHGSTQKTVNFKRRLRMIRSEMRASKGCTLAQEVVRMEYERQACINKKAQVLDQVIKEKTMFAKKQKKRAEKHRGH